MAGLPLGLDKVGGLCSCEYWPADTAFPLGVDATELEGLWNRFKPNKSLLGFLSSRTEENTFIATTACFRTLQKISNKYKKIKLKYMVNI